MARKLEITINTFACCLENNVDYFFVIIFIIKRNRFIVDFSELHTAEQFFFPVNANINIHRTFNKTSLKIKCMRGFTVFS